MTHAAAAGSVSSARRPTSRTRGKRGRRAPGAGPGIRSQPRSSASTTRSTPVWWSHRGTTGSRHAIRCQDGLAAACARRPPAPTTEPTSRSSTPSTPNGCLPVRTSGCFGPQNHLRTHQRRRPGRLPLRLGARRRRRHAPRSTTARPTPRSASRRRASQAFSTGSPHIPPEPGDRPFMGASTAVSSEDVRRGCSERRTVIAAADGLGKQAVTEVGAEWSRAAAAVGQGVSQRSPLRETREPWFLQVEISPADQGHRSHRPSPWGIMGRRRRYLRPPHTIVAHGSGQASSQRCTSSSRSAAHANPGRCCSLTTQPAPVPTSSNGHVEPINSTKRPAQKRSGATMSTRAGSAARLARRLHPRDPSGARRRTSITSFDPTRCSSTTIISPKATEPCRRLGGYGQPLAAPTYVAEEGNLVEPVCSGPTERAPAPEGLRRARRPIAPVVLERNELESCERQGTLVRR